MINLLAFTKTSTKVSFLFLFSILFSWNMEAQSNPELEELIDKICQELQLLDPVPLDTNNVTEICYKTVLEYCKDKSEKEQINIINTVDLRLQTTCPTYFDFIVSKTNDDNEEWKTVTELPESVLKLEHTSLMKKRKSLYYIEPSDLTPVKINITKNKWLETYHDGTYSQTSLEWTNETDFILTFIKSNHPMKEKLSLKGSKYYYRVIDQTENYYLIANYQSGTPYVAIFKLHY